MVLPHARMGMGSDCTARPLRPARWEAPCRSRAKASAKAPPSTWNCPSVPTRNHPRKSLEARRGSPGTILSQDKPGPVQARSWRRTKVLSNPSKRSNVAALAIRQVPKELLVPLAFAVLGVDLGRACHSDRAGSVLVGKSGAQAAARGADNPLRSNVF